MDTERSLKQKQYLRDAIAAEIDQSGLSNNRFASERLGFSATSKLSHVLNSWDKPGLVGEETWQVIEKYLSERNDYKIVATDNLLRVWNVCERAYQMKRVMTICGEGGYGKTLALLKFKEKVERERRYTVYYFDASMVKTRKQFIVGLMKVLGCYKEGTISAQLPEIREYMRKKEALLIIDEISSLEGRNVTITKDIMTALYNITGIVFAGTPYFVNNINKGASRDAHLFSETKDRMFMIPEKLNGPTETEAEAIFKANGITGEALNIVMGRNPRMMRYSYKSKPTFRGISDCIVAIKIAVNNDDLGIKHLQVI